MSTESTLNWPKAPFAIERLDGMPTAYGKDANALERAENPLVTGGNRSLLAGDIDVDPTDAESVGEAVFELLVRGESDPLVIARTLGVKTLQVRALIVAARSRFAEAALAVRENPEARRMALAMRAEWIGRQAMSAALSSEGNVQAKFLGLALRTVVEQAKLEGLDVNRVEVTEHKIDETRKTFSFTATVEDQLASFGVDKEGAAAISQSVVGVVSRQLEKKLKAAEDSDIIDAEFTDDPPTPE